MNYYIHHLNDLSGSPLILLDRLKSSTEVQNTTLLTNHGNGFLKDWQGNTKHFHYTKYSYKALRFLSLSFWYFRVMIYLSFALKPGDKVVVSTLISSPLLAVPLLKSRIQCELMVNEVFFRIPVWRSIGLKYANSEKVKKTYLSKFVSEKWRFSGPSTVSYPRLREDLVNLAQAEDRAKIDRDALKFFLVGSHIEAKGYKLFIQLAEHFEKISKHRFQLFLSGDPKKFASEYPVNDLPKNLRVEFNNSSPKIFMGQDVFLGLTNPELWVETFGQTFAEAMIFGNIVVVPPVGAQLEYIVDGKTGFVFEEFSKEGVIKQIEKIIACDNIDQLAQFTCRSMSRFNDSA